MSQPAEPSSSSLRGNNKGRGGSNSQLYRPGRHEGDDRRFNHRDSRASKHSGKNQRYTNAAPESASPAPPTILLKTRATAETRSLSPVDHQQTKPSTGPTTPVREPFKVPARKDVPGAPLQVLPVMTGPVKLLGEELANLQTSLLQEFLSDEQDFLVVGCVGPQWTGKSSLLSRLAVSE